jgi:LasA protease
MNIIRITAWFAAVVLPVSAAAPALASAGGAHLDDAVVAAMLAATGQSRQTMAADGRDFQVNVSHEDAKAGWSSGTAVITAAEDSYPDGWVFVAHHEDGRWSVGLDGSAEFGRLAQAAPEGIMSARELEVFAAAGRTGGVGIESTASYTTELRLPYAIGQAWRLTGGPHGDPRASIDLAGGDGRVLAAGSGNVYLMCSSRRGWLRVYHPNGYTSDYYHLSANITPANGTAVAEGAFLGNIGVDVSCGGSATGPHVHWSILKGDTRVPWHQRSAGKWVFFNGINPYEGFALHGSARVDVGGTLYNYGRMLQSQGLVDTFGGGTLNKRSGPGTNFAIVGSVADGATVDMVCWRSGGTSHTGRYGTTSVWDKLSDGTWVSDAFIYSGMVLVGPSC